MIVPTAYFTAFAVQHPVLQHETPIATIWRVKRQDGSPAAIKLYKNDDLKDESPGFDLLRRLQGQGAVQIYAQSGPAILMEWLTGPLLGDFTRQGQDESASLRLVQVAAGLQTFDLAIPTLPKLADRFQPLFDAKFSPDCPSTSQSTLRHATALAKDLLANQSNIRPLHGDLHHDNIACTARGDLAFDAKGVLGDRAYELANAFRNPLGWEKRYTQPETILARAAIWSAHYNVPQTQLLNWAAAHSALSIAWTCGGVFGQACANQTPFIDTLLTLSAQSSRHGI